MTLVGFTSQKLGIHSWGADRKKVGWVKWEKICKSKCSESLGIKDIWFSTRYYFGKWKWRLCTKKKGLGCGGKL